MNDRVFSPDLSKVVEFYKLIPDGRPPKRADRSAAGYMPARALRYCDAMTTATGYGYWVFPVADLQLLWDGEEIFWSFSDDDPWVSLTNTSSSAIQYPGFADQFDDLAPEHLKGWSPPFMTALPEPGAIQIWTGLIAQTKPGWSLMLREPVNLAPTPGLAGWEGVIETDQWAGPIFAIFRLTKTDVPVRLRADTPFLQLQPIPQAAYRESVLNDFEVKSLADMPESTWSALGSVLQPDPAEHAHGGAYAVKVRKRRSCPYHLQHVVAALDSSE